MRENNNNLMEMAKFYNHSKYEVLRNKNSKYFDFNIVFNFCHT